MDECSYSNFELTSVNGFSASKFCLTIAVVKRKLILLTMMIKDLGARIESVWEGLRPLTKKMLVGALQAKSGNATAAPTQKFSYDTQSDWELSRLLTAFDEQLKDAEVRKNPEKYAEVSQFAETIVSVLQTQTELAEVFIQLAERALEQKDYKQIDLLANALAERFSIGEMCEIVRQSGNPMVRALGNGNNSADADRRNRAVARRPDLRRHRPFRARTKSYRIRIRRSPPSPRTLVCRRRFAGCLIQPTNNHKFPPDYPGNSP